MARGYESGMMVPGYMVFADLGEDVCGLKRGGVGEIAIRLTSGGKPKPFHVIWVAVKM